MIPAWLRRHLDETGVTVHGYGRRARVTSCPRCHAAVLRGLTEDPCSVLATADLAPLSNLGEAIATLAGRTTYDLAHRGGRLEMDLREQDHIKGSPPEDPDWWRAKSDVLAAHRCHTEPLPAIDSRIP